MSKNTIIVPMLVLLIVVLVIGGGYLIFKSDTNHGNEKDVKETPSIIESSTTHDDIDLKVKVSGVDLKPTAKPNFEVGQSFKYKTTSKSMGESITSENVYNVERTERINGTDNYIIVGNMTQMPDPETGEILYVNIKLITYVDKETGIIHKMIIEIEEQFNITLEEDAASASGNNMYVPWMLALKENLEWNQKINMTLGGEDISGEENYKVVGVESVNGKDCFKVKVTSYMKLPGGTSQKIQFKQDMWIDVYKRILVKSKSKFGNLATEETELIDTS